MLRRYERFGKSSPQYALGEEIQVYWNDLPSALTLPTPRFLEAKYLGLARHLESVITSKQFLGRNGQSTSLDMMYGFWTINLGYYS